MSHAEKCNLGVALWERSMTTIQRSMPEKYIGVVGRLLLLDWAIGWRRDLTGSLCRFVTPRVAWVRIRPKETGSCMYTQFVKP
jgi:hypothetical protein